MGPLAFRRRRCAPTRHYWSAQRGYVCSRLRCFIDLRCVYARLIWIWETKRVCSLKDVFMWPFFASVLSTEQVSWWCNSIVKFSFISLASYLERLILPIWCSYPGDQNLLSPSGQPYDMTPQAKKISSHTRGLPGQRLLGRDAIWWLPLAVATAIASTSNGGHRWPDVA
jgi:hypothetical protein